MMKRNLNLIFPVFLFILSACSGGQEREPVVHEDQELLPPSLQGEAAIERIELSGQQQQNLHPEIFRVQRNVVDHILVAPGVVFPAPEHSSIISAPIAGQIRQIYRSEGHWVNKGDVLFQIESLEYGTLVSEYLQAHAEEEFQASRLTRMKQLVEETISSVSELERATSEYRRASASVRAAYSRLKALGVLEEEIRSLVQSDDIDPVLRIHAPISGSVDVNFVEPGQSVNALENLSRILDTRTVLVRGYLSPDEARLLQVGDSVRIMRREDETGPAVASVVSSVNPGLDENSRSVVVNSIVSPDSGWPLPGENVRMEIISSTPKKVIAIPVESLSYDGNQAIVFVQREPGIFEKRPIEVSEIGPRHVFVASGLQEGEKIASSNVFSLKALSRYDMISEE